MQAIKKSHVAEFSDHLRKPLLKDNVTLFQNIPMKMEAWTSYTNQKALQ